MRYDQQSSTAECSIETASPPSYNHTAPPPPYTAHARLGEVSIHRSPLQEDNVIGDYLLVDNAINQTWLDDSVQEHDVSDNDGMYDGNSYTEEQVTAENSGEISHQSFHEDQPDISPLAASTPSASTNGLHLSSPTSSMFVKSFTPLEQNNSQLPLVKPVPMLRPIRAQHFSAPNLFATYPPPAATHEIDSTLNNTLPRVGRLPPLRRKPNVMNNTSPHHTKSLSDSRLPSPFYDNCRALSRTVSAGEYEPINEVSHEPSSNETIDNS